MSRGGFLHLHHPVNTPLGRLGNVLPGVSEKATLQHNYAAICEKFEGENKW